MYLHIPLWMNNNNIIGTAPLDSLILLLVHQPPNAEDELYVLPVQSQVLAGALNDKHILITFTRPSAFFLVYLLPTTD